MLELRYDGNTISALQEFAEFMTIEQRVLLKLYNDLIERD